VLRTATPVQYTVAACKLMLRDVAHDVPSPVRPLLYVLHGAGFRAADTCCNAATCKYNVGCQCANYEPCCLNGAFRAASANFVCRAAVSACDTAETCDGASGLCPADLVRAAGSTCGTGGNCYKGLCLGTFDQQCNTATGTTAGFCEFGGDECKTYAGTAASGGLWCRDAVGSNSCTLRFSSGAPAGTPCATGRQCFNGTCSNTQQLKSFSWLAGPWGACANGVQTRTVSCVDESGVAVLPVCIWHLTA